jgi:hypothetical protein
MEGVPALISVIAFMDGRVPTAQLESAILLVFMVWL